VSTPARRAEAELTAAVEALRADRRSGASALARQVAAAVARWAAKAPAATRQEFVTRLRAAAQRLAEARPSMLALAQVAGLLVESAADAPADEDINSLRHWAGVAAQDVVGDGRRFERIAHSAVLPARPHPQLLGQRGDRLRARRPDRVVVCESRPRPRGAPRPASWRRPASPLP
jgi:translation initiation factor 2B subunit (eIF-2B alpha/beta/delta family)